MKNAMLLLALLLSQAACAPTVAIPTQVATLATQTIVNTRDPTVISPLPPTKTVVPSKTPTVPATETPEGLTYVEKYFDLGSAYIKPIPVDVPDITQDVLNGLPEYKLAQNQLKTTIVDTGNPSSDIISPEIAILDDCMVSAGRLTHYDINEVVLTKPDGSTKKFNEVVFTFVFRTDAGQLATWTVTNRSKFYGQQGIVESITPENIAARFTIGEFYTLNVAHTNAPGQIKKELSQTGKAIEFGPFTGAPFTFQQIKDAFKNPVNHEIILPPDKVWLTFISDV